MKLKFDWVVEVIILDELNDTAALSNPVGIASCCFAPKNGNNMIYNLASNFTITSLIFVTWVDGIPFIPSHGEIA